MMKQVLARGIDYGDSRVVICGMHWKSDIQVGRLMTNATYDSLKGNDAYDSAFDAIKKEIDEKLKA